MVGADKRIGFFFRRAIGFEIGQRKHDGPWIRCRKNLGLYFIQSEDVWLELPHRFAVKKAAAINPEALFTFFLLFRLEKSHIESISVNE
jgi:hypothetical protein